jgi:hypothetical protein
MRIGIIGRQAAVEFILMGLWYVKRFRLSSDTVPDLFHQEDALGETQPINAQGFGCCMHLEISSREMSRSS